jgi:uncharacterized protein
MKDFHVFEVGGGHFVFFPCSARLYQLSPQAAERLHELYGSAFPAGAALPKPWSNREADESEVSDEIRALLRGELSFSPPSTPFPGESIGQNCYQTFSIYLAQSCNMSCDYCWNRGGSFGKPHNLMSRSVAELAVRMIVSLVESSGSDKIFINFYGGEPLLNFPVLRKITLDLLQQEARVDRKFCFTVDSNGLLLEGEAAQFLARYFTQIGVSLDGRQEVHDSQRPGKFGAPTWRRIVDNVRSFPDPKLLGLRATLTASSDSYLETFHQLSSIGAGRIQLEYCHEPGYQQNPVYEKLLVPQERQLAELLQFVEHYVDTISKYSALADIPHTSNLLENIARLRRGNRFTRPCGAGVTTLAIDCNGTVFPCIAFVDRAKFAMGKVGGDDALALHKSLAGFSVDSRIPCNACWLRYDCAGGCYATNFDMTGQVRSPHSEYCTHMRAKAEIHLYALARMLEKCPWHLQEAT